MKVIDLLSTPGSPFNIAIVVARFNPEVTTQLLNGALARLKERGYPDDKITVVHVPGAVEIPLVTKKLIETSRYRAIIALGAVIRGETAHFDYVCQQVSDGCQRLSLDTGTPIILGVLTTENEEQALARSGGAVGNKGIDCVDAALEMVAIVRALS